MKINLTIRVVLVTVILGCVLSGCMTRNSMLANDELFQLYKKVYAAEERLGDAKTPLYDEKGMHTTTDLYPILEGRIFSYNDDPQALGSRFAASLTKSVRSQSTVKGKVESAKQLLVKAMKRYGAVDSVTHLNFPGVGVIFPRDEWVSLVVASGVPQSWFFQWRNSDAINSQKIKQNLADP